MNRIFKTNVAYISVFQCQNRWSDQKMELKGYDLHGIFSFDWGHSEQPQFYWKYVKSEKKKTRHIQKLVINTKSTFFVQSL